MSIIKSKYFSLEELVQPSLIKVLNPQILLGIFTQWRLTKLDTLRADYEKEVKKRGLYKSARDKYIYINGKFGNTFKHSGLRSLDCPEGAPKSKHKLGKAFDLKCRHLDVLLYLIRKNWKKYNIARLEKPSVTFKRGWLHIEILEKLGKKLYEFYP